MRVMTSMGRDLGFFGVVWGILIMAVRCRAQRVYFARKECNMPW